MSPNPENMYVNNTIPLLWAMWRITIPSQRDPYVFQTFIINSNTLIEDLKLDFRMFPSGNLDQDVSFLTKLDWIADDIDQDL